MNDGYEVIDGAVSVRDGRIASVGAETSAAHDIVIDAAGAYLLPGFVQTHIHLCQTLFRGYADDLRLLDWLRTRIWPMEAAHTPASLRAAARLACSSCCAAARRTILTMETVHDTDAVFEAVSETGIRATIGKCMMDAPAPGSPRRLQEDTRRSHRREPRPVPALARHVRRAHPRRLRAAVRGVVFARACSRRWRPSRHAKARSSTRTRPSSAKRSSWCASANRHGEHRVPATRSASLTPRLNVAHCVWVEDEEQALLAAHDVKVTHCPGSNLKLGSGIAPVPEMLARGICVSLGSDGAACNNHLDMFGEMRLAATLQATRREPGVLPARQALWMATRNGARALGLDAEIGSDRGRETGRPHPCGAGRRPRLAPIPTRSPPSFTPHGPGDVRMTMVDGDVLVLDGESARLDAADVVAEARREAACPRRAGRTIISSACKHLTTNGFFRAH